MIVPDLNLLVYAYSPKSPFHSDAKAWWEKVLVANEEIGLPSVVLFGFIRLATNRSVVNPPMNIEEVRRIILSWLAKSHVSVLNISTEDIEQVLWFLAQGGSTPNRVTDAQIAAIAKRSGGMVHTTDEGFKRFPGVRSINPLSLVS